MPRHKFSQRSWHFHNVHNAIRFLDHF
jgi:hypothetical protein